MYIFATNRPHPGTTRNIELDRAIGGFQRRTDVAGTRLSGWIGHAPEPDWISFGRFGYAKPFDDRVLFRRVDAYRPGLNQNLEWTNGAVG